MARKVQVTGGGGSGSGKFSVDLELLSSTPISLFTADDPRAGMLAQLNANQFLFALGGVNNPSNQLGLSFLPFQVSDSGVVTLGTAVDALNNSGTGYSSTVYGEPAPGRIAAIGWHHQSGAYAVSSYGGVVSSSNTVTAGRTLYALDNNTYYRPRGTRLVGVGSTAYHTGYDANSYGAYNTWAFNGTSHYTYSASAVLNSYSSTSYSGVTMQHWSDSQARCGIMSDHRSAAGGHYWREYHGGGSSNLGYGSSIFGVDVAAHVAGYRFPSKACYVSTEGNYCVTDGAGTLLKTQGYCPQPSIRADSNLFMMTAIPLGDGYYAGRDIGLSTSWCIYKPSLDASNNLSFNYAASVLTGIGLPGVSTNYLAWRLAGASRNYLVIASPNNIRVYDSTPLTSLMV